MKRIRFSSIGSIGVNMLISRMIGMQCTILALCAIAAASASFGEGADPNEKLEYYDDGRIMSRSEFTPSGILIGKHYYYDDGKVQKVERYDAVGKKIEESNYDKNGNLDDNFDGWAAKRWLYKDDRLKAESSYGQDGRLTERKIYNDEGDLVDRQYIGDGKIDPSEEFDRGTVVTKETDQFYDEYGNRTGSAATEVDDLDDML